MDATHTSIAVRLPDTVQPTREDVEALEAIFEAIVALRFEEGREWQVIKRALVADSWDVRTHLMWVAEARRGRESEQGIGRTKNEAYGHLQEFTTIDDLSAVP
jgi:hypothetical protein